jgi:hypothetical protein
MPFVNAGSNVDKVGRGRRDLIPVHHHHHRHLVNDARNQTLEEQGSIETKIYKGIGPPFSSPQRGRRMGKRRGTDAISWERAVTVVFLCTIA